MPFLAPLAVPLVGAAVGVGASVLGNALSDNKAADSGVSLDQINNANNQVNNSINGQQSLVNQLAAQGGIQNQSDVYNQQQALANQLGLMAQGQGPNPALNQLNQTTAQNVQQQGALMASQRGSSANPALIARQAAQVGSQAQQQAAGQAATLRAQQQLASIGALQNQQNMLGGLATTQVGQQMGAQQNLNNLTLSQQQALLNARAGQNTNQTQLQREQNQSIRGGVSGAASGLGAGIIGMLAEGGEVSQAPNLKENYKGRSRIGLHLMAEGGSVPMQGGGTIPGKAKVGGKVDSYANDVVPILASPGEWVIPRSVTQSKDPKEAAMKFIEALLAKKSKK